MSDHEAGILAAVAAGADIGRLLLTGAWSMLDVAAVLKQHGLAVSDGGSIVRADVDHEQLLALAQAAPDPVVRRQAERARALLTEVSRALATRKAAEAAADTRRRRRESLLGWLTWLHQATAEAQHQFDRLAPRKPNRSTRSPE